MEEVKIPAATTSPGHCNTDFAHGTECECLRLAEATQGGPQAIPFSYCYHVLQKRYRMSCRHGQLDPVRDDAPVRPCWSVEGAIDAVTAILIRNA